MKKYYEILNIPENASEQEIKKSYKKKCLEFHPDKNIDNKNFNDEKFKELNTAYNTLIDPIKRKQYDDSFSNPMFNNLDISNMFKNFFNIIPQHVNKTIIKAPPIFIDLKLTLKENYLGCVKNIKYTRNMLCRICSLEKNDDIIPCDKCNATGNIVNTIQFGPNIISQQITTCYKCNGSGKIIINKCTLCNGQKLVNETEDFVINIPCSIYNKNISIEQKGNCIVDGITGDLVINILVTNTENIYRIDDDLYILQNISLFEALIGLKKIIEYPLNEDEKICISSDEILTPNCIKKINNMGFHKIMGDFSSDRGDLYIKFNIIFPSTIKQEYKEQLTTIFEEEINDIQQENDLYILENSTKKF